MTDSTMTALAVVLDKSDSMHAVRDATISGFNEFLHDQQQADGEATLSLTLFDTLFENRYVHRPLGEVPDLDRSSYTPSGMTALLDAVGSTIDGLGRQLASRPEGERPARVLFVIQTDGQENSSREYPAARVKEMIAHQRDEYGWEFLFLGADQDAWLAGGLMGIDRAQTISYDNATVDVAFATASNVTRSYRGGQSMGAAVAAAGGGDQGFDYREAYDEKRWADEQERLRREREARDKARLLDPSRLP